MKTSFNRHALIWIQAESREPVAAQIKDDALRRQIAAWLKADRPSVVARRPCGEVFSNSIPVGVALPLVQGKAQTHLPWDS